MNQQPEIHSQFPDIRGQSHQVTELATAAAYHEWLPGKSSGDVVAHDGVKANHQILAEVEHVQQGGIVKHAAFLDILTLHQHVTTTMVQMSDAEMAQYEGILRSADAGDIFELALQRPIVRDDYAYVLA